MFGLTFEKLFVIGLVAAFLIGPHRLPFYAARLARLVRAVRDVATTARLRAEAELGTELSADQWRRLDVRQYDPRRIVRDALRDEPGADGAGGIASAPRNVVPTVVVESPPVPVVGAAEGQPAPAPPAPTPVARPRAGSDGRYRRPVSLPVPTPVQPVAAPVDSSGVAALAS